MSTKALKKELLVAVVMLLVAAVALSGSTYAWFAVNNSVTAEGPTVTTQTANNLFIAPLAVGATAMPAENTFVTADESTLGASILEPVSTISGETGSYYYNLTSNTGNTGARTDTQIDYVLYDPDADAITTDDFDNDFQYNYQVEDSVAYVDYAFALKAANVGNSAAYINFDKIALIYSGVADASKAYRVAIFWEKADANGAVHADVADGTNGHLLDIKSVNGAVNFTTGKAVKDTDELDTVTMNQASTGISVTAESTEYFKVVVRLWLEGEDNTCKNDTYMDMNGNWHVDLTMTLSASGGSAASDQYLTKYTSFTASDTNTYYCDGTNVYLDIHEDAVTSAGLNDDTLETEIETAFGVTIS